MPNDAKHTNNNENQVFTVFTANEVANTLGENYKSVAKILNTLATQGKINVTEKLVNNRPLKGYCLSIQDLQEVKSRFLKEKHLLGAKNTASIKMAANALSVDNSNQSGEEFAENTNVKFYEVLKENAELTRQISELKQNVQEKISENVRLDADLSMARSELKFITDKSATMESAWAQEKQRAEALEKVVKSRNIQLLITGAVLLVVVVVICCYFIFSR